MVRVRFAPSPTGFIHIGSARTALFNWLFARSNNGSFILRIEDTDVERSREGFVLKILEDLKWLGLEWDEGPDKGGPFAPYKQSERADIYRKYADKLLGEGKAYYCYCTDDEIKERRDKAIKEGEPSRLDDRCQRLSQAELDAFKQKGIKPAIRFMVPDKEIVVHDIIRGDVIFDTSNLADFIIMKSSDTPSFNFAVVCDDCLMEVSHIIRGEDHLPNAPKHVLIFEALGFKVPQFAHMSLTMAPGGERLSKRTGAASIGQYREEGYLPEALVNYMALLGWSPGDDREVVPLEEMIRGFSLERLSRSSEAFDLKKLDWMNGLYIRSADIDRLARLCIPYLERAGYVKASPAKDELKKLSEVVAAVRDHLIKLSDITEHAAVFFDDTLEIRDEEARELLHSAESKKVLTIFLEKLKAQGGLDSGIFEKIVREIGKETQLKGAHLYHPIRAAITGKLKGPELKLIVPILGKESCIARIKKVLGQM